MTTTLVIGNKNYSSWSLRPWLALKQGGVDFDEVKLPLDTDEFYARIGDYSKAGKVPVLLHGDLTVWDSLAICEYAAETFDGAAQWPADRAARAVARAACAEMHSGFSSLRREMPMNIRRQFDSYPVTDKVREDVERVVELWAHCRKHAEGEGSYLFGGFTIADAMYAPVVSRFTTYKVALPAHAAAYCEAVMDCPAMREWVAAAMAETEIVESDEV